MMIMNRHMTTLTVLICLASIVFSQEENHRNSDLPQYLIIGAGGSGLQLALFFEKFNLSYSILEKESDVGSHWTKFPRFEELISVNKWTRNETTFRRYDWHSMLEAPLRMYDVNQDYFPKGRDWQHYMHLVAEQSGILKHVEFNVEVESVSENGRPCVHLVDGSERCASKRILIGTGLKEKQEPLLRALGGVPYSRVTKEMAMHRRVCILGNGNSAFEVAQNVFDLADRVTIRGKNPHRLMSVTRYSGDLRTKYLQILENYHAKLLDTVQFDHEPMFLGGLEEFLDESEINEVRSVATTAAWLEFFKCELFVIATGFQSNVPQRLSLGSRFPVTNSWYQSVDNPTVHYIGWLTHEQDFRKSSGGFLQGFRYHIRNLAYHIREQDEGIPYPRGEDLSMEQAVAKVIARLQTADDLIFLQDGVTIKDAIVPVLGTKDQYHYYEGISYQFHEDLSTREDIIYVYFAWGNGRAVNNVFDSHIRYTDTNRLINLFLHPVVEAGGLKRDIHEDPEMAWTDPSYVAAIERTIREALNGDLAKFRPKKDLSYERSSVNQTEPTGDVHPFEAAMIDFDVDEGVLQALWKAVYTGEDEEMEKLKSTAEQHFPYLFRLDRSEGIGTNNETAHCEASTYEVDGMHEDI